MKVAIIGYGVEGQSALKYWQAQQADVTLCDANPNLQLPAGVAAQLGPDYLKHLDRFDLVMRTASINPKRILAASPHLDQAKITTVINEFLAVCPTQHVIGVTGTKGKGTTTTLIAKMLEATGKTVFVAGNIGVAAFDLLPHLTPDSWVVLELSSFQLYDLTHSTHIALCLTIAPEHLDWHTDMDDYTTAKAQLFAHQTQEDIAIYYANDPLSKTIASHSPGTKISYYAPPGAHVTDHTIAIAGHTICRTDELKLLGAHNWQNACAATTAVWHVAPDPKAIRSVLTTFSGLEHRLEFVRETDGVSYYNDSFGTTPETAIVAIQAFNQPKILILGGSDKGSNYTELAGVIARSNLRQVILIGNSTNPDHPTAAPTLAAALQAHGVSHLKSLVKPGGPTMTDIVAAVRTTAQPGDVVLLSPACASFDMFDNYKDRGQQFKSAVQAL